MRLAYLHERLHFFSVDEIEACSGLRIAFVTGMRWAHVKIRLLDGVSACSDEKRLTVSKHGLAHSVLSGKTQVDVMLTTRWTCRELAALSTLELMMKLSLAMSNFRAMFLNRPPTWAARWMMCVGRNAVKTARHSSYLSTVASNFIGKINESSARDSRVTLHEVRVFRAQELPFGACGGAARLLE